MKKINNILNQIKFAIIISIIFPIFLLSACNPNSGKCEDWVAKVDDEVICKSQIDAEYNVIIETYAKMQGVEKEKFLEMISDDNLTKSQPLLFQLRKRNFIQRYINEYLFYREALNSHIQEDPKVIAMLNYQRKTTISQFFLEKTLKKSISISEDEIEAFYKKNRRKYASLRQLPITDAFKQVKKFLQEQKKQKVLQQKVQEMRDKFKIEFNKSFANDDDNEKSSSRVKKKEKK